MRVSDIIAYIGKDRQDAERAGMDFSYDGSYNAYTINNLVVNIVENSFGKDYINLIRWSCIVDSFNSHYFIRIIVLHLLAQNVTPWIAVSIPIVLDPGTTAIRTDTALIERAISSDKPITLAIFVPGAGSNSYNVTTGPGLICTILPITPNSCKSSSNLKAILSNSF